MPGRSEAIWDRKPVRRLPEPAKPNTALYADPAEGPIEISAALAAATKDHKRVLLIFGGNWCYDCHVLDTTFHSKEFAPLVNANFHVVHVNIGNYDVNLDLAKKYEIPLEKGVPSLAVLDPDGTLLVSQKKGEFESTVRIGPEDVLEFLNKWKPNHGLADWRFSQGSSVRQPLFTVRNRNYPRSPSRLSSSLQQV